MDCIIHGVAKSQARLSKFHFTSPHFSIHHLMDFFFYFLAIMNNAAVNMCEQFLGEYIVSFLLCRYLEVKLLSYMTLL